MSRWLKGTKYKNFIYCAANFTMFLAVLREIASINYELSFNISTEKRLFYMEMQIATCEKCY